MSTDEIERILNCVEVRLMRRDRDSLYALLRLRIKNEFGQNFVCNRLVPFTAVKRKRKALKEYVCFAENGHTMEV